MASFLRFKVDPADPNKALEQTINVTPAWWRGDSKTFEDGSDVLRSLDGLATRHDTPCGELLWLATDVRIGVKSVLGHARRSATLDHIAEFAAERAGRGSTRAMTTAPTGA